MSFDRNETAQVVVRALQNLGVDGRVNERNDICVGTNKIGSAYKIVNNRAYHHGTMLISTQLDTLGDLLRVANKVSSALSFYVFHTGYSSSTLSSERLLPKSPYIFWKVHRRLGLHFSHISPSIFQAPIDWSSTPQRPL
ncbi:hypothetical protein BKA70DRAFT_1256556 [Coprinopsis sp. MPI-PUGE-AT-0042]|nr:hypothetical protein BKA70DRAFT_1256556 [Coprinopsis sp. MPI-PUGE-AT-0042]